ncbi:MAG: thioredoxin family protein [Bdellovibrionaceae bacterium]|nr:thioredoxin family protein [Pseudobdellovibrionaceae bacterium]
MVRSFFLFIIFFLTSFQVSAVESVFAKPVRISWLAPKFFHQNEAEVIGLYFQIDPEWHVYWKNSGDSGAPPKFNFHEGHYHVGPIQWPIPKRISAAHLVNLGYEKEVAFLFPVTPTGPESEKELKLSVKLEWLVCKVECIPGFADLTLTRPIRGQPSEWARQDKDKLFYFQQKIPANAAASPFKVSLVEKKEDQLIVDVVPLSGTSTLSMPDIFPVEGELIHPQPPQVTTINSSFRYTFSMPAGRLNDESVNVLLVSENQSWEQPIVGLGRAGLSAAVDDKSSDKSPDGASLLGLLFFAFIGGVILNLMPCVLPVLSIKFLSIIRTSIQTRRREAVLYMAGVLVTFLSLGCVLLILRSAGAAIGWGFQLQSPVIVLILIILFWLMSLNFLGFFEFGESVTNMTGRFQSAGAFSTGVLAVFVAAPCTGPFMGTALGAAAVLPAPAALGIFLSLGLGLGFPFALVSFVPSVYKMLPRPGVWMDKLKQFLAFPLLGTVVWLMWVLGVQLGTDGWLIATTLMLLLVLAIWLGKTFSKVWVAVAYIASIVVIAFSFISIKKIQAAQLVPNNKTASVAASMAGSTADAASAWTAYDRNLIDQARSAGRSVFVDFTAAWCITCQVNKKTVLDTEHIQNIFKENNVLIMRADWTNQDPLITQALAEFDRNSVPVYLFYEKGAAAIVLPQILTFNVIESLFKKKE